MIDFIKCWLKYVCIDTLLESSELEFNSIVSHKTGEIGKQIAVYNNLKFVINKGRVTLQGSLHKYKNGGEHNYDDFTWEELTQVLQDLKEKFNIRLEECILLNLEIGVNIIIPIACYLILNNLMFHYGKSFKDVNIKNGNYKIVKHQRYSVKVYDKGLQYKIEDRILRFELHYTKMIDLNKKGIHTLQDLIKEEHYNTFLTMLITEWEKILLFDCTINAEKLSKHIRNKKLLEWNNIRFWEGLTQKQARDRQKKSYNKVVEGHSERTHERIKNMIIDKWNQLTKNDDQLTYMING